MATPGSPYAAIPAGIPPLGVVPNYIDPPNINGAITATAVITIFVATVTTFIRIYTKLVVTKLHGLEDYLMVSAWLGLIAYEAICLSDVKNGAGTHQWDLFISKAIAFGKRADDAEILYSPIILMAKMSILLQIERVFVPSRSKSSTKYIFIVAFMVFNILFYTALCLVTIFQCTPREAIWNPLVKGRCVNYGAVLVIGASINIFSDLSLLAMPVLWTWRLQMPVKRKVGVSAVFATASFGVISSALRLYESVQNNRSKDSTYSLTVTALWTIAELTSGIVAGNMPIIPRFVQHCTPWMKSLLSYKSGDSSTGTGFSGSTRVEKSGESKPSRVRTVDKEYHELVERDETGNWGRSKSDTTVNDDAPPTPPSKTYGTHRARAESYNLRAQHAQDYRGQRASDFADLERGYVPEDAIAVRQTVDVYGNSRNRI
ncbi:hypothetical protein MMC25_000149 [Agyrium rufum]|nr:hypothetical protein [Agyrium rufum]